VNHGSREGRKYVCDDDLEDINGMPQNARDQALCYFERYADLRNGLGCDLRRLQQHWLRHGKGEGRTYGCLADSQDRGFGCNTTEEDINGIPQNEAAQAACYLARYTDLQAAVGCDPEKLRNHYLETGEPSGRVWGCDGGVSSLPGRAPPGSSNPGSSSCLEQANAKCYMER